MFVGHGLCAVMALGLFKAVVLQFASLSPAKVLATTSLAVLQRNLIESDKRAPGCRGSSLVTAVLSERGQSSALQSTCMDLGQCFKVFI